MNDPSGGGGSAENHGFTQKLSHTMMNNPETIPISESARIRMYVRCMDYFVGRISVFPDWIMGVVGVGRLVGGASTGAGADTGAVGAGATGVVGIPSGIGGGVFFVFIIVSHISRIILLESALQSSVFAHSFA